MAKRIASVEPGGIARELGLRAGDTILSINGEPVCDLLDYQALTCAEAIDLETSRGRYSFEKDEYDPLGLSLEADGVRRCANRCVFCFVDQLPPNVRESMRVKDDDWRYSLLMGNYVTLTNVYERETERIIRRGASPLYISVHATDPELRKLLLGCARGGEILPTLQKLGRGGVSYHLQAVICPGLNDGAALQQTVRELAALHPWARSLALVPVGLTAHREGLYPLKSFDAEGAKAVVSAAKGWQKEYLQALGTRFVYPSDEFYLLAGEPLPADEAYEDYPQLDNGVGLLRLFETEFACAHADMRLKRRARRKAIIATGKSARPFFEGLLRRYPVGGLTIEVRAIENTFFGESVTVSGLVTGGDLIRQLRGARADAVFITQCMLRAEEDVFLDGTTLAQVRDALGIPVVPVGRRGEDLLDALIGLSEE